MDLRVTGRGEAVLQVQDGEDLGAGWGVERDVQVQSGQAAWIKPGRTGRYLVAEGRQWWLGWHMTWQADQGEGLPVRKEWGGELPRRGTNQGTVRAYLSGAKLAQAPTTQGHRG